MENLEITSDPLKVSVDYIKDTAGLFIGRSKSNTVWSVRTEMERLYPDVYKAIYKPGQDLTNDYIFGSAFAYHAMYHFKANNFEETLAEFLSQCEAGEYNLFPGVSKLYQEKHIEEFKKGVYALINAVKARAVHSIPGNDQILKMV